MKILSKLLLAICLGTIFWGCKKDNGYNALNNIPVVGSNRVILQEIQYINGKIEGSNSWATWPVAIFAADAHAVKYSVKVMKSGKTYTWEPGRSTNAEYDVYPSSYDKKEGKYFIGLGRTWCSDCENFDANWEENYRNNVFASNSKVEITVYY